MSRTNRIFRLLGFGVLTIFVSLQFFRPKLDNDGNPEGPNSLVANLRPPVTVRRILQDSCYDCHSNHTQYPWFAHVQPFGWVIDSHVREGKRSLNLSTFGILGKKAQSKRLDYMAEALVDGEMPYWPYRLVNLHANPGIRQVSTATNWLRAASSAAATKTPLVESDVP